MKKICFICLFSLVSLSLCAQHSKVTRDHQATEFLNDAILSEMQTTLCSGGSKQAYNAYPLLTHIKNLEKKNYFSKEIADLKAEKTKNKRIQNIEQMNVDSALNASSQNISLNTNFKANAFNGGAPPDNTLAIANNGNIVSVINCNVAYYNNSGAQLWTGSFWELFNDPTLTEIIYDPIVLYDSQADRFVMIVVHGFTSSTSKLIISFSKSNNPLDGWWVYKLSGNPLNNSCWLDYPKLGISNNEVFVTGNLFGDNTGYSESVIYQIRKNNGYAGLNLTWSLWSNIAGSPITLIPVSYGQQGNYGPGLYFLNQSPGRGNAVQLYEITNELNQNPQITRNVIAKPDYAPSGNALQLGTAVELITTDCKILNAFYLDGIIHYVFQTDYQNSNYSGINYNRLQVSTLTNRNFTYGEIGFDCAFPSVASFATTASDRTVIFCFLRSGASIFPETRAVLFNNDQTWSNTVLVKAGVKYVDAFQFDNAVRWGDYSGIAYKYNPTKPEVWVSGCYGSTQRLFNTNYNCFNNWIGQITNTPLNTASVKKEETSTQLYPNPAIDLFSLTFDMPSSAAVNIDIVDIKGSIVKNLYKGQLKSGKNALSFNRNTISNGNYFIRIESNNTLLLYQKLIFE